ncbi:MAG TPA: 4-(cytidine 5'-diphospho)-2-C-methyl-D-erythritol kinase [Pyrinomonadaceae bacterium]|nr:4-(cytidine 5'-diphospho)-2-C-methyl-D-erythritol kinase [Pyrinomonadaceae bacterium]
MSESKFKLPAYAKINLSLRVLGRRVDGYHEIRTVFQTITLHDTLEFERLDSERLELTCDDPGIPTDESNLVLRAALALREHFGVGRGARIRLEKRIPAQGGLGGGSADAAVSLIGLARLWELPTSVAELARLGARLGADVPFFLTGGTALGTGLGTDITPLEDVPVKALVLVAPGVGVSTVEAYKALNADALTKPDSAVILHVSRAEAQISDSLCEVLCNDFEPVVFRLQPEIERAKKRLLDMGARCALMSGSGSSVFGVFDEAGEARRAAAELSGETLWQVFPCETLSRSEYLRSFGGRDTLPLR